MEQLILEALKSVEKMSDKMESMATRNDKINSRLTVAIIVAIITLGVSTWGIAFGKDALYFLSDYQYPEVSQEVTQQNKDQTQKCTQKITQGGVDIEETAETKKATETNGR